MITATRKITNKKEKELEINKFCEEDLMKKKLAASIMMLICMSLILVSCGQSAKDQAIDTVNAVKLSAYMTEDQKDVKALKSDYVKKLEKTKSDESAEKVLKKFKSDLKTIATRKDKVKAYKELVLQQAGDKSSEAEKILNEYSKKLNAVKSDKELSTLSEEINKKVSEATGTSVAVTTDQVEGSTPAAKSAAKTQSASHKTTSTASSTSKSSSSSSSSGSSSNTSSKKKVWVVDQAAWTETKYRTETYTYSVYRTSDGREFSDYNSAYAYYCEQGDNGNYVNFGAVSKTGTRQVPYTVTHPEQGHWEYR